MYKSFIIAEDDGLLRSPRADWLISWTATRRDSVSVAMIASVTNSDSLTAKEFNLIFQPLEVVSR